jgi:replicative DNA helicase
MSGLISAESDFTRISHSLTRLAESKFYIDESAMLSPVNVRSKLRRLVAKAGPLALVVIDYLQLMQPLPENRQDNREAKVAGISRALKILAREFSVPFLVLSQLNRESAKSTDKRPTLQDLRESGALEQDADVVILIHRPEVYEAKPENYGLAEWIIAKQRNGPVATVQLTWRKEQMRFENRTDR